jgi:hypothetical protein
MTNDPWAAAAAPQQSASASNAGQGGAAPAASGTPLLADAMQSNGGGSLLFRQGKSAPALFNKTHFLGEVRTGIITEAPKDVQDRDFDSKMPKYFSRSKVGKPTPAITTDAIDGPTGQPNDKVMVVSINLMTDYRMDERECGAVGRDTSFAREDDGTRVETIGGRDLAAFQKAMEEAGKNGIVIRSYDDFKGLRLTSKRAGQVPAGNGKAWVREFTITRP